MKVGHSYSDKKQANMRSHEGLSSLELSFVGKAFPEPNLFILTKKL